jgi:hypothetical protein
MAGAVTDGAADGAPWFLALFVTTWCMRADIARRIDRHLGVGNAVPAWMLPVRDLVSVMVMLASYRGDHVRWHGQVLRADRRRYQAAVYTAVERINAI